MSFVRQTFAIFWVLAAGATLLADDVVPTQRLISDSAAVCLEITHPEVSFRTFQSSRLASRLREFPPAKRFMEGPGFQKWTSVEEYVRRATDKSLSDHVLAACAESLTLAVYLPDGKPPEGVVIAQSRDEAALKKSLQAWATLEPNRAMKTKQHQGYSYTQRAKSTNANESVYYATFGTTFAISDREQRIQQVIELHAAAANRSENKPGTLADLPLYQASRSRLPQDAVAFLFLNARKWDKVVQDGLRQSRDAAWILHLFDRTSALAATLRLDDEVVVDLVADLRVSELPAAWQKLTASTQGGESWEQRIPTGAIAAISCRMDIASLVELWLKTAPDAKTDEFVRGRNVFKSLLKGRDPFNDVLPKAIRDWTLALVPATDQSSDLPPADLIGRFQLGEDPLLFQSVDNGLQFGMTLLAATLSHEQGLTDGKPVLVESRESATTVERWMSGLKNCVPAYQVSPGRLLLASSPRALAAVTGSAAPASKSSRLARYEQRYFQATSQLAWLDLVSARELVAKHGSWIATNFADSAEARQRVERHLSKADEVAKLFDGVFIATGFDQQGVHLVLGGALDRRE